MIPIPMLPWVEAGRSVRIRIRKLVAYLVGHSDQKKDAGEAFIELLVLEYQTLNPKP